MKTFFRSLVLLVCISVAARAHDAAQQMADAANRFVDSLTPELRAKAVFDFQSGERKHWEFVPKIRTGLTIKEMNDTQKLAAFTLLASGLSADGMGKATNIMSLDSILKELEAAHPGSVRDPQLYYVSVYGKPGPKDAWSWRVEGHHLSINFTIVDGAISATPEFFGSNPAEVLDGPRKGLRILAAEEDNGYALLNALTDGQKKIAIYTAESPGEIITGNKRKVEALKTVGLPASQMTPEQKTKLVELVRLYAERNRAEVAADDLAKIEKAGWDDVHFGWAGSTEKGKLHYYRIQGPTFLMEMDNKDKGNHVHSVWRDFANDFGEDLLAEHYKQTPHN
jgi:hypothetical protein